jgi:hypothetical protein
MVTNFLCETSSLGSPGLEGIKWLKPVYPGDTLRLQSTMLETKPMGKRPDVGMTRNLWEMFNQHGDKVLHMEGWGMFRRRTPARLNKRAEAAHNAHAMDFKPLITLLAIVNPLAIVPFFIHYTQGFSPAQRKKPFGCRPFPPSW